MYNACQVRNCKFVIEASKLGISYAVVAALSLRKLCAFSWNNSRNWCHARPNYIVSLTMHLTKNERTKKPK